MRIYRAGGLYRQRVNPKRGTIVNPAKDYRTVKLSCTSQGHPAPVSSMGWLLLSMEFKRLARYRYKFLVSSEFGNSQGVPKKRRYYE